MPDRRVLAIRRIQESTQQRQRPRRLLRADRIGQVIQAALLRGGHHRLHIAHRDLRSPTRAGLQQQLFELACHAQHVGPDGVHQLPRRRIAEAHPLPGSLRLQPNHRVLAGHPLQLHHAADIAKHLTDLLGLFLLRKVHPA